MLHDKKGTDPHKKVNYQEIFEHGWIRGVGKGGRGATNISHTSHEVRWHASSLTVLVHSTDNMLAQSEQVSLVKEKRKKK